MPPLRTYSVFISHAWNYSEEYYRMVDLLNSALNFRWRNLSVPEHDPFDTDEDLEYELRNQIRPAEVVLVLAGMYVAHSDWIDWEMKFAGRIGIPIVGILPWASVRTPVDVQNAAVNVVGWNTNSIVAGIRWYARVNVSRG